MEMLRFELKANGEDGCFAPILSGYSKCLIAAEAMRELDA
jgi:hypothetical protein